MQNAATAIENPFKIENAAEKVGHPTRKNPPTPNPSVCHVAVAPPNLPPPGFVCCVVFVELPSLMHMNSIIKQRNLRMGGRRWGRGRRPRPRTVL